MEFNKHRILCTSIIGASATGLGLLWHLNKTKCKSFKMSPSTKGKKRVLVTGGTGLVGHGIQWAVDQDKRDDEEWVFLDITDGDLRDPKECDRLFSEIQPTHVIHLAAFVGGLFHNISKKVDFWRFNVAMNENIYWCSHKYKVKKLVSALSTCVFPDKTTYPIDETMIHNGAPHVSNEGYAYAKRMLDLMNRLYFEQYGDKFTSVIPTNIYGPHDNYNIEEGHVIPGLIHKCYVAKRDKKPFICYGSGRPLRQFIFSHDLGKLLVWVLRCYDTTTPLILSVNPDAEVSIKDVVNTIVKAMDFKGEIIWDTSKADGQYKKTASNSKLRSYLPKFQFSTLEEGINESVRWFIENFENARK